MYDELYALRTKYGEVYVTVFPDGTKVPWKQLSLQDFLHYSNKFSSGRFPVSHIEDEIFRKCCVDQTLLANLDLLDAGLITTVVTQIMEVSGPSSIEDLRFDLNVARSQVQDFISDAIGLICQTFPGYTPETLYNMDYQTFMKRLALAERRLLSIGFLQQPISIEVPDVEVPENKVQAAKKRLVDLNPQPVSAPVPIQNQTPIKKTKVQSSRNQEQVIIRKEEMRDLDTGLSGHDMLDKALWDHDVMDGLQYIYPELFKKLQKGEKITPDVINATKGRTPEEVKERYREYINKLKSGEIRPPKSNYLIADKLDGQTSTRPKPKKKATVKVKRG